MLGGTEVNVFLVALGILPFLQNMLLNIGTGHYKYMYIYVYKCIYIYIHILPKKIGNKRYFAISEKKTKKTNLSETIHYIPKVLRKGNPFHGPFAKFSYIYIHIYIAYRSYILYILPLFRPVCGFFGPTTSTWLSLLRSMSNTGKLQWSVGACS